MQYLVLIVALSSLLLFVQQHDVRRKLNTIDQHSQQRICRNVRLFHFPMRSNGIVLIVYW